MHGHGRGGRQGKSGNREMRAHSESTMESTARGAGAQKQLDHSHFRPPSELEAGGCVRPGIRMYAAIKSDVRAMYAKIKSGVRGDKVQIK